MAQSSFIGRAFGPDSPLTNFMEAMATTIPMAVLKQMITDGSSSGIDSVTHREGSSGAEWW